MTTGDLYELFKKHPKVSKDTREDVKGAIYFSIRGENYNGNRFAKDALKKGAAYVVVDDLSVLPSDDHRYIHVPDSLRALQDLASFHRSKLNGEVIAITGSNGKTSTKELMARVLSRKYSVFATPGNYNNHIGIPLMLLQTPKESEFVIVEMGASKVGDVESYCRIANPDYGIITNVGQAHLETFGGLEGVRRGKGELYSHIAKKGKKVFICADEKHLPGMAKERKGLDVVPYFESDLPIDAKNKFCANLIESEPQILFEVNEKSGDSHLINSTLHGEYNFRNILTAMAVGYYFDVSIKEMAKAIQSYRPISNRSEIRHIGSNLYYFDAYNANPTSMKASLRAFHASFPTDKVLVIGDMLELGEYAETAHQNLVDYIKQLSGVKQVFLVGEELRKTEVSNKFHKYDSVKDLKKEWKKKNWQNQNIFLKGSRSIGLEKLIE